MAANEAIIRGVASILQNASAALAQLGMQAPGSGKAQENAGGSLADAAASLASLASQFSPRASAAGNGDASSAALQEGSESYAYGDGADASVSTVDFCNMHGLDAWVGEALDLLTPEQRIAVMDPPMNTGNARNLNGIVVSRIKQAVPLDQRLGIFVQINGLSEGVVDRISTLTPEQADAVMESGMKIQKASNPSGVAMRRISDVLKQSRAGTLPAPTSNLLMPPPVSYGGTAGSRSRSRTPAPSGRSAIMNGGDTPEDIQAVMNQHGLEWWCGEVLKRLSLYQRQQVLKDIQNLHGARNPSGVVMSRVKQFAETTELMSIFIDINQFDSPVQSELWSLTPEQQSLIISPGIYLQNVRNPSTAVRSRIKNVLAGNDAFGKPM